MSRIERLSDDVPLYTLIRELLDSHPVFRSKPIGAPHSEARERQQRAIAAEDKLRARLQLDEPVKPVQERLAV